MNVFIFWLPSFLEIPGSQEFRESQVFPNKGTLENLKFYTRTKNLFSTLFAVNPMKSYILSTLIFLLLLRRIANRAILVFSGGQKSCTRIMSNIFKPFLHFLKVFHMNFKICFRHLVLL